MARASLKVQLKQKHSLALNLRQSLQILSFSSLELSDHVKKVLEDNPFLEEGNTDIDNEFERVRFSDDGFTTKRSEFLESIVTGTHTLQDYLLHQLSSLSVSETVATIARDIISMLNTQGFTDISHDSIKEQHHYDSHVFDLALEAIRDFDPIGIGAEDLWQSLSWQALYYFPDDHLLQDIIAILQNNKDTLTRMSSAKVYELAEALGLEVEQLYFSIEKLAKLDPYPARRFLNTSKNIVYPDIVYRESERGIDVIVQDRYIPELSLNLSLYQEYKKSLDNKAKGTWQNKFTEAQTLVSGIDYRNTSLEKLAQILLEVQKDFFLHGPIALKPLNLVDVAEKLDLHISTISRIVSQKYCQCQWGVFSLKSFFPARIKSNDGENRGVEALRQAIISQISQENRQKPLSDQKIQSKLQEVGFDVQRRTVAKYRKLLHIPAANVRKV